jgi:hypothetical protein
MTTVNDTKPLLGAKSPAGKVNFFTTEDPLYGGSSL